MLKASNIIITHISHITIRHQTPENTRRWRENREGEADLQGKGGHKECDAKNLLPAGTGTPFEAGRGESKREGNVGKEGREHRKG